MMGFRIKREKKQPQNGGAGAGVWAYEFHKDLGASYFLTVVSFFQCFFLTEGKMQNHEKSLGILLKC